ncbi:STM4014 family protein [Paenibacillus nasutitermitis]|uniref:ATP-grasp domain-containing protein n=1 Tax=Paenibacillus nasutitermitis TaxID=1652958 RepID=A0A916YXK9_9BACL|nr:STM4014 family protein [Paenibacillus nasutitermitis]GGD66418.1 hypothetical protein GCM10010911_25220 [Paenibacillus nasutitermitis]
MRSMILIGNPGNRRTASLQEARRRLQLPPAVLVPYLDLIQGTTQLEESFKEVRIDTQAPPLVRIDAPGEDFEVERALIALGAPDVDKARADDRLLPVPGRNDPYPLSEKSALALKEQRGRLYHPAQWFRGFTRLLAKVEQESEQICPDVQWTNAPADIAGMFDKRHTHRVLTAAGVSVPRQLEIPEALPDYWTLHETMCRKRMHRVFVKLAAGSGACGIMAYQINPTTGEELAITTIGVDHFISRPPQFYNALKLRRYTDTPTIRLIVNWLLSHGAHVEQWVAKAAYGDRTFDLRQLVVAGAACHCVGRVSRTPITNLHLRSVRMSPDELGLSATTKEAVRECAESALKAFSRSSIAGVDVVLSSGSMKPYVVDVNPFGDLLYNVLYQGVDPYEWEMGSGTQEAMAVAVGDEF